MEPTLFASFADAPSAERCIGALLDGGVDASDISLIVHWQTHSREFREATDADLDEVEAGETNIDSTSGPRAERLGSLEFESPIGGGISTSTRDDAVSGIEEMDEGQAVAERMIYPDKGSSYSSEEAHDVAEAANTGFFNTTAPEEGQFDAERASTGLALADRPDLDALIVPGLGLVLGGGTLATDVVGAGVATQEGGRPAAGISEYLMDHGVDVELARKLTTDFDNGGAVLAVAIPAGTVDDRMLRNALRSEHARNIETRGT